jgi:hypothetical protein
MIPSAVAGSSSTYLCDYLYAHNAGHTNILLAGGAWEHGDKAGIGYLSANNEASMSNRQIGARLEFI